MKQQTTLLLIFWCQIGHVSILEILFVEYNRITHVNDGFIFLSHRIIRKHCRYGDMQGELDNPEGEG
ncbi:group II intron-encoded reverse transcriptase/maturase [Klebsiella michiganensis]|nr:group II intron-encoded reverse transcriptase/maturase [Klebsiella michiganensis]KZT45738.1 hypothetical protein A6A30_22965 [Klebsiella michiganensis]